jgi:hypothetical protein
MLKQEIKAMIIVNIFLFLFLGLADYGIGNELNSYPHDLRYINWSPFLIQDSHAYTFVNGNLVGIGGDVLMLNIPFWLFLIAVVTNIYFLFRFQRSKETKQSG